MHAIRSINRRLSHISQHGLSVPILVRIPQYSHLCVAVQTSIAKRTYATSPPHKKNQAHPEKSSRSAMDAIRVCTELRMLPPVTRPMLYAAGGF